MYGLLNSFSSQIEDHFIFCEPVLEQVYPIKMTEVNAKSINIVILEEDSKKYSAVFVDLHVLGNPAKY